MRTYGHKSTMACNPYRFGWHDVRRQCSAPHPNSPELGSPAVASSAHRSILFANNCTIIIIIQNVYKNQYSDDEIRAKSI
jgi:hypothetical protein